MAYSYCQNSCINANISTICFEMTPKGQLTPLTPPAPPSPLRSNCVAIAELGENVSLLES